ncbi:MAG: 3-hydroxyacyl-CoA dehydrogenase family protein [Candidatus Hydrogenedentes bacterium]|nr:3-hydroxyacyl-CoA dehydrogenase family protein [Candidatus Hydrogenedentota bacterium]
MQIQTVAVVGAGFMGSGIAQVCAQAGRGVALVDVDEARLTKAREGIAWSVGKLVSAKRIEDSVETVLGRIRTGTSLDLVRSADLIIEAVYEEVPVKQAVLNKLEPYCAPHTIIGSNTSTIPITVLSLATQRPDRVIGTHFFGPVPLMRLVEVIPTPKTSEETLNTILEFTRTLGKNSIVVKKDVPGFLMNRVFGVMLTQAVHLLEIGAGSAEDIDRGMCDGFNMRMGPLGIADLAGLDIALNAARVMHEYDPQGMLPPSPLLEKMVKAGKLGKKSGEGFFKYDAEGKKVGS